MNKLLTFLYGDDIAAPIQVVFGWQSGAVVWCPGKKVRNPNTITNSCKTGLTGRVFESYEMPATEQASWLFWTGVDIDGWNDWQAIPESIPASVRTSKSGTGLHLLFRFEKPIQVPVGCPSLAPTVKAALASWLSQIEAICGDKAIDGHGVCKLGGNFWLYGGLQETLRISEERIPAIYVAVAATTRCQHIEVSGDAPELLVLFWKSGVVPVGETPERTQIWTRQVFEALQGTAYAFETRSPMRSTNFEVNGFIGIEPVMDGRSLKISIFTNADGRIVKSWVVPNKE